MRSSFFQMFETTVQEYVDAARKMEREAFCQHIGVPVLVAVTPETGPTLQSNPTKIKTVEEIEADHYRKQNLDPTAVVLEIRPTQEDAQGRVSLGRSEDNDLVLNDDTVSSHHAIFTSEDGQTAVEDQRSTNGSLINSGLLPPGWPIGLKDGDVVSFGDTSLAFFTSGGFYEALHASVDAGVDDVLLS